MLSTVVPQSSSVYGQDPYAPPFNWRMISQQNKRFSDRCPQDWITGLFQAQQARNGLFLYMQILPHSQTWKKRPHSKELGAFTWIMLQSSPNSGHLTTVWRYISIKYVLFLLCHGFHMNNATICNCVDILLDMGRLTNTTEGGFIHYLYTTAVLQFKPDTTLLPMHKQMLQWTASHPGLNNKHKGWCIWYANQQGLL